MIFTNLHASSWSTVGKPKEKGLFDFDFITWMAWTWPTASFFIFIALCITVMYFWEKKDPGGHVQAIHFIKSKSKRPFSFALPTVFQVFEAACRFVKIILSPLQIL